MHCLICQSVDTTRIHVRSLPGYRCASCGFEFLWEQPRQTDLIALYGKSYYDSWGIQDDENANTTALKRSTFARYLKKVQQHKPSGTLLDIGCAFGYLLEEAERLGYTAYGLELSEFSSSIARERFGERITCGTLQSAEYPDGFFDVITLFDLIEHVPDPHSFMRELRRIVKPDGIVALVTPDTGSLSRVFLGRDSWVHYKAEHLLYFNPTSLRILADAAKFSVISQKPARKSMSISYIAEQFQQYPHPLYTRVCNALRALLPRSLSEWIFPISGGEMFVLLKPHP